MNTLAFAFKKTLLLSFFVFITFSFNGNAQCSITGTTVSSNSIICSSFSSCSVIYVGDGVNPTTLVMNQDIILNCLGAIQFIIRNNANIDFSNGNYNLELAENSSIVIENGGNISAGSNCSASDLIMIGNVKVASCNGNGGALSDFPNLVTSGGFNTVNATSTTVCGSGTATIEAFKTPRASNTTYKLYTSETGGTAIQTILVSKISDDAVFTTPVLTSTTNFFIEATASGVTTPRRQVTVTVVSEPIITTVNNNRCGTGTIVLSATASAGTINWYAANTGGSSLATGTSFITPSISTTTIYYVDATNSGCASSSRTAVIATVNSLPVAPTVGTITLPTCSTTTGSVVLNGLPSGNWIINPGAITGTGTSTTISGLVTGNYNYTVTNSAGCTSLASTNVVINVQSSYNIWKGSKDNNWNEPLNWCTGVPSTSNNLDVLIPSALSTPNSPTLGTGSFGYVENIIFESGSILTVENNYLFVKKNLKLNGKIDLNNESQLVQDTGSTFDAASIGTIEIDQQGTSDNYKYNYWGSPVNTTGNTYTIAGVLRDGTDPTIINESKTINFATPYTYADGIVTSPIKLSSYWMYKFDNKTTSDYNSWTRVGKDGDLKSGEGYTMKGSNSDLTEQNYTFVGKPNNGDIYLPISVGKQYLIGNPYPSAIDAKKFIRDNIQQDAEGKIGNRSTNIIDGNLYFWDHFGGGTHFLKSYEGGYSIFNLSGGVAAISNDNLTKNTKASSVRTPASAYFIPMAQGFFVTALDGGEIQFKNSQREFQKENNSVSMFLKSAKTSTSSKETSEDIFPRFHLSFKSPEGYQRQLLLAFIENTTDGIDIGYDAINNENFPEDISWRLNNANLVIQAVPTLNENRILPLEVKLVKSGIVKINIDDAENMPEATEIFIKDNLTGLMHNISKNPFEIELIAGKHTDRFVITFKTQKLAEGDVKIEASLSTEEQNINKYIHVYVNKANNELQIESSVDQELVSVVLYNYLGQSIKSWDTNLNSRTVSLPINITTGIYVAHINTKTGKAIKKLIIQ